LPAEVESGSRVAYTEKERSRWGEREGQLAMPPKT